MNKIHIVNKSEDVKLTQYYEIVNGKFITVLRYDADICPLCENQWSANCNNAGCA